METWRVTLSASIEFVSCATGPVPEVMGGLGKSVGKGEVKVLVLEDWMAVRMGVEVKGTI